MFSLGRGKWERLAKFNLLMAGIHGLQGLLVLLISSNFSLPVITRFLEFNERTSSLEQSQETIINLQFAPLIAGFFFLSATMHLFVATRLNKWYVKNLKQSINPARWYEYSFSASIMMVAIAMLAGVYDLSGLIMIFMLTAIMNLMGLMMEVHNQTTKHTDWLSFNIGVIAGIVPWAMIALYFIGSTVSGGGASTIPTFVYWIYGSLFLFFNCFAINMFLQYKKVGKWKDYIYGERVYIWLSLIAKSLLAWQVFAGTLQPA
jgi:hypothetical protein